MAETTQDTDTLIDSLTEDLCPVKVLMHPLLRVLPWCVYAVLYVGLAIYFLGLRYDFEEVIYDPIFVFEMVLVLVMSLSAAVCSMWMCVPDMRGQQWLIAVPTTLFMTFLLLVGLKVGLDGVSMPKITWHHCHSDSMYIGFIPAATIWFLTMRGKTTCYVKTTFMNVLAVGGLGYLGLRLTCGADNMGHISFFHILPYLVLGIVAGLVARRIYRW